MAIFEWFGRTSLSLILGTILLVMDSRDYDIRCRNVKARFFADFWVVKQVFVVVSNEKIDLSIHSRGHDGGIFRHHISFDLLNQICWLIRNFRSEGSEKQL